MAVCGFHNSTSCTCALAQELASYQHAPKAFQDKHREQYEKVLRLYQSQLGQGMVSGRDSISEIPLEQRQQKSNPEPKTKVNKLLLLME